MLPPSCLARYQWLRSRRGAFHTIGNSELSATGNRVDNGFKKFFHQCKSSAQMVAGWNWNEVVCVRVAVHRYQRDAGAGPRTSDGGPV